jgi:hypothetical protein
MIPCICELSLSTTLSSDIAAFDAVLTAFICVLSSGFTSAIFLLTTRSIAKSLRINASSVSCFSAEILSLSPTLSSLCSASLSFSSAV